MLGKSLYIASCADKSDSGSASPAPFDVTIVEDKALPEVSLKITTDERSHLITIWPAISEGVYFDVCLISITPWQKVSRPSSETLPAEITEIASSFGNRRVDSVKPSDFAKNVDAVALRAALTSRSRIELSARMR